MEALEITRLVFIQKLVPMLPTIVLGVVQTTFALLVFWVGHRVGWYRGVKDTPDVVKKELAQARFERGVAEERLDIERKVSKRFEVMVRQLVDSSNERPTTIFGMDTIPNASLPKGMVVIKNVEKPDTKFRVAK